MSFQKCSTFFGRTYKKIFWRILVAKWFLFPLTSITLMKKKVNGTEDPNILQNIIFCVIQKKVIGLEWHECEYMTDFSFLSGLTLKTFFRYSKGYRNKTSWHFSFFWDVSLSKKEWHCFSDMYVAPFFIWEPYYTYLVARVHTVQFLPFQQILIINICISQSCSLEME